MQPAETNAGMKRIAKHRLILLIVTAAMLLFIFIHSTLPKSVSLDESEELSESFLDPLFRLLGLEPLSQHTVRKVAHVFEFAVLSGLLVLCFRGHLIKTLSTGFLAAFLDESIQLLCGRGAEIADVWIDLIGIALGAAIGFFFRKAVIAVRRRGAYKNESPLTDPSEGGRRPFE